MYLRPAIGIGGRSDRHDRVWMWEIGAATDTWGLWQDFSADRDRQWEKDWLGGSWEFWTRLWFSFLFWNFLPARVIRQQSSFPMLINKVLAIARAAVVIGGKRGTGRSQRPFFSSNCSWSICFNREKSKFSYQIHRLKELQPCEGRRPLQNRYWYL